MVGIFKDFNLCWASDSIHELEGETEFMVFHKHSH